MQCNGDVGGSYYLAAGYLSTFGSGCAHLQASLHPPRKITGASHFTSLMQAVQCIRPEDPALSRPSRGDSMRVSPFQVQLREGHESHLPESGGRDTARLSWERWRSSGRLCPWPTVLSELCPWPDSSLITLLPLWFWDLLLRQARLQSRAACCS